MKEKTKVEFLGFLKNKCKYKIKKCEDKSKAEALEYLAILLKPEHNKLSLLFPLISFLTFLSLSSNFLSLSNVIIEN